MKDKRYKGTICTRDGHVVRVELWQETERPYRKTQRVELPYDEPLTIEWSATGKEEAIEKSHATLRLISPGDRTYADLYEGSAGDVRLDIYVDDSLWWSGILDQEQYEEPYYTDRGYEVSLTFGDFGILGRKRYHAFGVKSIADVVDMCRWSAGLRVDGVDFTGVSLRTLNGERIETAIGVDSEAWVDNDGVWAHMEKVAENILGGLGLKMRQRGGKIWVYDIAGLGQMPEDSREVWWSSTNQVLGADRTYDEVKVRWSPDCREGNLMEDQPWGDHEPDENLYYFGLDQNQHVTPESVQPMVAGGEIGLRYLSWPLLKGAGNGFITIEPAYTIWMREGGEGRGLNVYGDARLMNLVPQLQGSAHEGILVRYTKAGLVDGLFYRYTTGCGDSLRGDQNTRGAGVLAKTEPVHLCGGRAADLMIHLVVDLCINNGYGFFDDQFSPSVQSTWESNGQLIYIPVNVRFRSSLTGKTYRWTNKSVVTRSAQEPAWWADVAMGSWTDEDILYDLTMPTAWLMWYDPQIYDGTANHNGTIAGGGFVHNRQAICQLARRLTPWIEVKGDGQYMGYPCDGGGELWVEILDKGWLVRRRDMPMSHNDRLAPTGSGADKDRQICDEMLELDGWGAWQIALGMPSVEVVRNRRYGMELITDDVEATEVASGSGEDDLEIETKCGTGSGVLMARGAYTYIESGEYVSRVRRLQDDGSTCELTAKLLAGEYGTRKVKLKGETAPVLWGFGTCTDAGQGNRRLWIAGEHLRLREMESDVELIEINDYGE